jgi:cell division protein FtsB
VENIYIFIQNVYASIIGFISGLQLDMQNIINSVPSGIIILLISILGFSTIVSSHTIKALRKECEKLRRTNKRLEQITEKLESKENSFNDKIQ